MQNRRNFYRILHVQPDAPVEIIRTSYRTLMHRLRMHPDLGGDHWNATLINEAFATLSNPSKRATYDLGLARLIERQRRTEESDAAPDEPAPAPAGILAAAPRHECAFCGAVYSSRDASRPTAMCACCGSALFPAVKLQAEPTSRRTMKRIRHATPIMFWLSWPQLKTFTGTTEDVSINGMRFTTEIEVLPHERLALDCVFCSAVAVVRHTRAKSGPLWEVGVEFLTLRIRLARGTFISTDV